MARASVKGKDAPEEIAALDELIAVDGKTAKNYYRRGLAHMRNHDADKARADFKTALAKDRRMKEATRALDRLATESKHWKKKPAVAEAEPKPAPQVEAKVAPTPEPISESKAQAKAPEPKVAAAKAPAENGPPDVAVSDRRPAPTAPAAKNAMKNIELPKTVEAPRPPQRAAVVAPPVEPKPEPKVAHQPPQDEAAPHPRHESQTAKRTTHEKRTTKQTSNERHQTQRRQVERHVERSADTRRPQVRYYYYRNGRQVSFSEAFR
jgi:hypothetical protein